MYFRNLIVTDKGLQETLSCSLINNKFKNTDPKSFPIPSLLRSFNEVQKPKILLPWRVVFDGTTVFINQFTLKINWIVSIWVEHWVKNAILQTIVHPTSIVDRSSSEELFEKMNKSHSNINLIPEVNPSKFLDRKVHHDNNEIKCFAHDKEVKLPFQYVIIGFLHRVRNHSSNFKQNVGITRKKVYQSWFSLLFYQFHNRRL